MTHSLVQLSVHTDIKDEMIEWHLRACVCMRVCKRDRIGRIILSPCVSLLGIFVSWKKQQQQKQETNYTTCILKKREYITSEHICQRLLIIHI